MAIRRLSIMQSFCADRLSVASDVSARRRARSPHMWWCDTLDSTTPLHLRYTLSAAIGFILTVEQHSLLRKHTFEHNVKPMLHMFKNLLSIWIMLNQIIWIILYLASKLFKLGQSVLRNQGAAWGTFAGYFGSYSFPYSACVYSSNSNAIDGRRVISHPSAETPIFT